MSKRLILTTRALCLSATLFTSSHLVAAADWESLPPLPEPNGGFVSGASDSRLVIIGGTNWEGGTKHWLSSIREYEPAKRKWTKVGDLVAGPIAYATALQKSPSDGPNMLAFVGGTDGKRAQKTLVAVDGSQTRPIPVVGLPDALVLSAGGEIDGAKFIVGGTDDPANLAGCQRSAHRLSIANYKWSVKKLPDYPGKPFCTAASATAGRELFVFGGANWDAAASAVVNASESYAFSIDQNSWRKLKPLPFAVRGVTAVALDDHRIYVAGGFKTDPEGFTSDAFIYDVKADNYSPARPLPYAAMVGLVRLGGFVYCIGGEDKMKHRSDKFFRIAVSELTRSR